MSYDYYCHKSTNLVISRQIEFVFILMKYTHKRAKNDFSLIIIFGKRGPKHPRYDIFCM